MADGSITFDVEILDKRAKQKLEELDNLIKSSGDSMDSELSHQAQKFINDWERASVSYEQSMEKIKVKTKEISDYQKVLDNAKMKNPDLKISDEATSKLKSMQLDLEKLQNNAQRYGLQMDKSGIGAGNLLQKIKGTTEETKKATKATETLKRSTSNIGNSLKGGLKSVIRLTTAMLGMRGIVTGLNKITREWYASNDLGAKQAQANMSAMTSGIVNLLAPALTFVTNLMVTLFGYINAIARAFFGVDLLAKNTSKNLGVGAGNAKKLGKEIKGFTASFDEADVASGNIADNLDGAGGGGGGNIDLEPNIKTPDLSKFKKELEKMFKPFLDTIKSINFDHLIESFEKLKVSALNVLSIIGQSFVNIMNESIAPFIKIMMEDIYPRFLLLLSEALDMVAPHLQWLLTEVIEPIIQWFLLELSPVMFDLLLSALEFLIPVINAFLTALENVWTFIEPFAVWLGGVFVNVLSWLAELFQNLTKEVKEDDSYMVKLFETIIILVGGFFLIKGVLGVVIPILTTLWSVFQTIITVGGFLFGVLKTIALFLAGTFSISVGAVIAIIAILITSIVGIATNFQQVKNDIFQIIGNIKGVFNGLMEFIKGVFTGDWKRAWKGIVQIFDNIVGGIANIFKFPINIIIDGLNAFIRGINKIQIPSWVPGVGGKGLNIGQIPRLAKGASLTHQTTATMAEYPNARTNPEIVSPQKIMRETLAQALAENNQLGSVGNQEITIVTPVVIDGNEIARVVNKFNMKDLLQGNGGGLGWNM